MNDKRDEVIGQATRFYRNYKSFVEYKTFNEGVFAAMADFAIKHALSREAEIRRQIADELTANIDRYKTPWAQIASIQANVIDKLRGATDECRK